MDHTQGKDPEDVSCSPSFCGQKFGGPGNSGCVVAPDCHMGMSKIHEEFENNPMEEEAQHLEVRI